MRKRYLHHRHDELSAQTPYLLALVPVLWPRAGSDDDHLVGAEVAQLVLDGSDRADRVAHPAVREEALSARPAERALQALSGSARLGVDVGVGQVRARAEHGREHVEFDPRGARAGDLLAQLLAVQRLV